MQPPDPSSFRGGTYVLTRDVASRLQAFQTIGINVPERNHPLFQAFEKRFLLKVSDALPGIKIESINLSDIALGVEGHLSRYVYDDPGQFIVSTCLFMSRNIRGEALSFNRLFDSSASFLGYGPRPGAISLSEQIADIARKALGRPIVLVEDGAFSGQTLCFVIDLFARAGLNISKVVVGFCCTRAEAVIREVFKGELVIIKPIRGLVDWIPDHDLVPFIPHCGRVRGEETLQGLMPIVTESGVSYSFPYIKPFGNFEDWASLSASSAHELSAFCLDASIELWTCASKRTGRSISARELVTSKLGVSMPIAVGSEVFPGLDLDVVPFLKHQREILG